MLFFLAPNASHEFAEHGEDEERDSDLDHDQQVVGPAQGLLQPPIQMKRSGNKREFIFFALKM